MYFHPIQHRSLKNPRKKITMVFAILPAEGRIRLPRNQVMINYRVDDLPAFVSRLKRLRVKVDPIEQSEDGDGMAKFTHLKDPDGNRLELWEPSVGV